jgi:hypothetical protein
MAMEFRRRTGEAGWRVVLLKLRNLPDGPRAAQGLNLSGVETRVAIPETEEEWLETGRGKTVHQLEALVTGKGPGDKPSSPSRVS